MKRFAFPLGLVALLVLAAAPPTQAAFHGSAWTATGVAADGAGHAYTMTLRWSGFCYSAWTLTIKDATTGGVVVQRTFGGYESQYGQTVSYMPEALLGSGYAFDPSLGFMSVMVQVGTVDPSPHVTTQSVTGTFGAYTFTGVVAEQWQFC